MSGTTNPRILVEPAERFEAVGASVTAHDIEIRGCARSFLEAARYRACSSWTAPAAAKPSIFRRLGFHRIDDDDWIRLLPDLKVQPQPMDAFKQADGAAGFGSISAAPAPSAPRRLTSLSAFKLCLRRPGESEVKAAIEPGGIDSRMIYIIPRHGRQFVCELRERGVLARECHRRDAE